MKINYKPKGVCAAAIQFDIEDNKVRNLFFAGGCDGSHKGISQLVEGMEVEEVAKRLKGVTCGRRNSSCPDQLVAALEEYMANK